MGYYVTSDRSEFKIKAENLDAAYKALCDLNERDDLKRGGGWYGGSKQEAWFSWMDANYPETCKDAVEVIQQLGFYDAALDENGDLTNLGHYDSKRGQEDLFFSAIAPFVEDGSYIEWRGEEGDHWRWEFKDGQMDSKSGSVVWGD